MDSVSQIQSHAHAAFMAGVNWAPGAPAQASNFCARGAPRRQCTQKERKKCEQEFASVIFARHAGANEATDARAPKPKETQSERAGSVRCWLATQRPPNGRNESSTVLESMLARATSALGASEPTEYRSATRGLAGRLVLEGVYTRTAWMMCNQRAGGRRAC